jgi:hypothetical protein
MGRRMNTDDRKAQLRTVNQNFSRVVQELAEDMLGHKLTYHEATELQSEIEPIFGSAYVAKEALLEYANLERKLIDLRDDPHETNH